MLSALRLPVRIAEGTKAKLEFDYACGRGHSFGEYHVHGVVNEILCSNLDPTQHRVASGFAHPCLQTDGAHGRPREVDFAVSSFASSTHQFYAEVKWAGSSHCSQENLLRDLCRLQLIKNAEPTTECVFVLAGQSDDIDKLFVDGILVNGTQCLLHRPNHTARLTERGRVKRTKTFLLKENVDHAAQLERIYANISRKLPSVPDRICTYLTRSTQSASTGVRFQALVWAMELY
ncbi:Hypothetical protein NGAL_HAMBI1145_29140 [Neorhizobium galegae bv. officinalis]|uniref:Uncharacterized protein n=1 Tax=Neorhizobium galegae bv. officinalis TaxID=323656 RepID=A0A0T7FKN7_NEOGA|nr:Hypothetical protein NGAL_HAMBI1145_29140 [Neorhizobium galegae bv. officinalis]